MRNKKAIFNLFLASALSLFLELALIRWVASEVRLFAFYKNFALIGAFLGLGLGFALHQHNQSSNWFNQYFLSLNFLTVLVVMLVGRTGISDFVLANQANTQEYIWAGYLDHPLLAWVMDIAFYVILLSIFALIAGLFIPTGYLVASTFKCFAPLQGYTVNIIGSLAGILLYTLISFFHWPPWTWFTISGLGAYYFIAEPTPKKNLAIGALIALPILWTTVQPLNSERTFWSPYYRIDLRSVYSEGDPDLLLGYELAVNQAFHQRMWNLDPDFVESNRQVEERYFDLRYAEYVAPYEVSSSLNRVLIVGAGTGNDVAGALRAGAKEIIAVEIDPLIVEIGRDLHPENPYANTEKVEVFIEDARSFFRRDQGSYDLIVFGLLDSHTLFSVASSVRLDNFVYTTESLNEVHQLLAEKGVLVLSFGVPRENEWIGLRLYRILTDVFGHSPQVYESVDGNIIFVIGHTLFPNLLIDDPRLIHRQDYSYRSDIEPTTDQWPFLYLREKTIPTTYLFGLTGVIIIGFILTRRMLPNFQGFNGHFFFLGAAFFLLETKSITEIALVLGSTWIVNAVVIAAILSMIVIANLLVGRYKLTDARPFYALLIATLLYNYFISISNFLGLAIFWRIALASLSQALPLFFAGLIFAISFSQTDAVNTALGSNLVGAVIGGIFEYASLALGIRSLYLLAMMFYVLSAIVWFRQSEKGRLFMGRK